MTFFVMLSGSFPTSKIFFTGPVSRPCMQSQITARSGLRVRAPHEVAR
jgi:hypothetical protein